MLSSGMFGANGNDLIVGEDDELDEEDVEISFVAFVHPDVSFDTKAVLATIGYHVITVPIPVKYDSSC